MFINTLCTTQQKFYEKTRHELSYNPRHKSLKQKPFVLNLLKISYIHSSHLCSHSNVPLSFPNVEPCILWGTTAIPKPILGKVKIAQVFQDLWWVLYLVGREVMMTGSDQGEFFLTVDGRYVLFFFRVHKVKLKRKTVYWLIFRVWQNDRWK